MKNDNIEKTLGSIDEVFINEAAEYSAAQNTKVAETPHAGLPARKRRVAYAVLAAACLAIVVTAGSAVAIIAEAKEYNEAVEYFEENGYSIEGLTRSEVKEIYRDIITQKFENEKTASVIRSKVSGTEISQEEPTSEDISSVIHTGSKKTGVTYTSRFKLRYDPKRGYDVPENCIECKSNGETLWKTEVKGAGAEGGVFHFDGGVYTSEGSAVWGRNCYLDTGVQVAQLVRIDDSGNVLWANTIDHGFGFEYVVTVLENSDGTWEVFSHGDYRYLCVSRFDADGNETGSTQEDIGEGSYLRHAVLLGEGYIIQVVTDTSGQIADLYKLDSDGNITGNFTYESDDCTYFIADMVEFGGQIYLSGYSVPYKESYSSRYETEGIVEYCHGKYNEYKEKVARGEIEERDDKDIVPAEELTPVVRDNYTAVLLICDSESGDPKTFYSVKGSLGGKLSVNGERLEWNVNSIVSAVYSNTYAINTPDTEMLSISSICKVWRYCFDSDGELLGQVDTGETDFFRR